ncbi:MAG: tRNA (guanosine(37)-N1)-methyltransferase TrmD [Thermodesulfobacteriota bacterium]
MRFHIVTIFPDFFKAPLSYGVTGRAIQKGLIEVKAHNLRDYTSDKHRTTDDTPYGGGCGMVMKVEPVARAIEAIRSDDIADSRIILTTPQGAPFTQDIARELSEVEKLVIICGRYEGVDERIRDLVDMEVSIGDYVLTGGEIPALVLIDSVSRLVQGVLGSGDSKEDDSFSKGLLEYPQYTRPPEFNGLSVPEVLLSGDHTRIEKYRRTESLRRTLKKRPDLLEKASIRAGDCEIITRLKKEQEGN